MSVTFAWRSVGDGEGHVSVDQGADQVARGSFVDECGSDE